MVSNSGLSISVTLFTILIVFNSQQCLGHRILGIFPMNTRSHMMMFEALMKGLARRGHQVDVVNLFPQKKPFPNYTDIIIPAALPQFVNNMTHEFLQKLLKTNTLYFMADKIGNLICEKGLEDPQIQKLIKTPPQNPPYDLVIVELFSAHCFMAFGHHFKVPVIAATSSVLYPWGNDLIANPENLAFVPNNLLEYMENMNLWQRLFNVVHTFYSKAYFNYFSSPQDKLIRQHFGPDTPGVRDLERSVAFVIVNSHYSLNGVKPTTPALIEVGGLHIQDDGPDIPAKDKKWLDESKDGFVFFTFGSMVQIESFPKSVLQVLYKSLGKIAPIRVLMKVPQPGMLPAGLPENIRTFSWIPQLKVLKHKNIRAFITHGGLMGTQEAISCAVPMIGVPLFIDQFMNINMYVKKKIAIRLDYMEMTEEKLDVALDEILHNPSYRDTVTRVSKEFSDRPMSPTDTACYWVEYIIRHGHEALRSPALDLTWWQVALLDVYVLLFVAILSVTILLSCVIRFVLNNICMEYSIVAPLKKVN